MEARSVQDALTQVHFRMIRLQREVLESLSQSAHKEMKKLAPVAFGSLQDSITKTISYGQDVSVAVISAKPEYGYAEAIEEGFRPMHDMPPWRIGSRLYLWTWLKGKFHLTEPKKIERHAFVIARALAEKHSMKFPVLGKTGKSGGRFYAKRTINFLTQYLPGLIARKINEVFK